MKLEDPLLIFEKYWDKTFRVNRSSESRVVPCGRQTDRIQRDMTILIVPSPNFANAPNGKELSRAGVGEAVLPPLKSNVGTTTKFQTHDSLTCTSHCSNGGKKLHFALVVINFQTTVGRFIKESD